jgi:hypothetical protein
MFQLNEVEVKSLGSQIVIPKEAKKGGRRYPTTAFTELGIAMLSSVLSSEQAVQSNIRTFFELRRLVGRDPELFERMSKLEKDSTYLFEVIFQRLDQLEINIPLLPPQAKEIRDLIRDIYQCYHIVIISSHCDIAVTNTVRPGPIVIGCGWSLSESFT